MTEQQRAKQALAALAAIDRALAELEDAGYEVDGGIDWGNDDLLNAIDRFTTGFTEGCDQTRYTFDNKVIVAPKDAIKAAAKARL